MKRLRLHLFHVKERHESQLSNAGIDRQRPHQVAEKVPLGERLASLDHSNQQEQKYYADWNAKQPKENRHFSLRVMLIALQPAK